MRKHLDNRDRLKYDNMGPGQTNLTFLFQDDSKNTGVFVYIYTGVQHMASCH